MLILLPLAASAWDDHAFVTDRALTHPSVVLPDAVPVEPLEAFLAAPGLDAEFGAFYDLLEQRGSQRFTRATLAAPTTDAFLAAARLNPATRFAYVRRLLPGEVAPGPELALGDVSPILGPYPPLDMHFVAAGPTLSAHDILVSHVDEPDWGFDRELFGIAAYGYGDQPYGSATGDSSIAPFHLQFNHENGLVRAFARPITEGMATERAELFVRLSRFAFASGHDYWGWRFAAWAMHYAEDLSQPYHSKALPSVGGGYYWRYVISPAKARMQKKAEQWATNRHGLYEDYVAWTLERSYTDDDPDRDALAAHLVAGEATWGATDATGLLARVMEVAADHARTVDEAVVDAFGPRLTEDWRYDRAADPDLRIDHATVGEAEGRRLIEAAGVDFENTGRAARNIVTLVHPG